MYEGDQSRKTVLVEYGFRLPSALDNRPLRFAEFMERTRQLLYVSATPARVRDREQRRRQHGLHSAQARTHRRRGGRARAASRRGAAAVEPGAGRQSQRERRAGRSKFDVTTRRARQLVVEQIIRPTGLLDPKITVRPLKAQIDETIELCRQRIEKGERVLITTLTKRTAEDLTDYLRDVGLKVRYLHSDIDTIERVEILRAPARWRVRHPRRHQSPPRRPRSARGLARLHPRCRQGRLSAQRRPRSSRPRAAPRATSMARCIFRRSGHPVMQALLDITEYRRAQADATTTKRTASRRRACSAPCRKACT